MKIIKKNQIIVYVIVLILMVAGYLNYTNNTQNQLSVKTSVETEETNDMQLADIGDATLVNSNDIKEENTNEEITEQIEDNDNIETNSTTSEQNYFIQSKLERENMYSQMIETYEKVLNSTNSTETQKQSATEEIQKINKIKNSIMICENLIKIKGFDNNIIFVNGQSINIVVEAEELAQEKIAQIQNIISREMEANIENIHITNK